MYQCLFYIHLEVQLGEDPADPDWKKLNKKADHKMKYKHSSGKILETLQKLRKTFKGNLDDARQQEKVANVVSDRLVVASCGGL